LKTGKVTLKVNKMGDYYFIYNFYEHRGDLVKPEIRGSQRRASEEFLDAHEAVKILGKASCGIWFYETALWNPKMLKQKLRELIKEVDRFDKEYRGKASKVGFKVETSY